jgi:hypothetical protein
LLRISVEKCIQEVRRTIETLRKEAIKSSGWEEMDEFG